MVARYGAELPRPIRPRAHPELRPESTVEVRYIAKAGVESDIEDPAGFGEQAYGSFAQARPQDVLVWGQSSEALERPQEMKWAESGLPSELAHAQRLRERLFDAPDDAGNAGERTGWHGLEAGGELIGST